MTWFAYTPGLEATHVLHGFYWETLPSGTVIDIDGSHDSISIGLAQDFPSLPFLVQNQPPLVQKGRARLPIDLQSRVNFMEHDLFSKQPVKSADVYLLR